MPIFGGKYSCLCGVNVFRYTVHARIVMSGVKRNTVLLTARTRREPWPESHSYYSQHVHRCGVSAGIPVRRLASQLGARDVHDASGLGMEINLCDGIVNNLAI